MGNTEGSILGLDNEFEVRQYMLKSFYEKLQDDKEDEMDIEEDTLEAKTNILDDKGKDLMICKILEGLFGKTDKVIGKILFIIKKYRLQ